MLKSNKLLILCNLLHALSPNESSFMCASHLTNMTLTFHRRLYLAAHYISMANSAKGAQLKDMAAQQLTSALRYCGIIPADRVSVQKGNKQGIKALLLHC